MREPTTRRSPETRGQAFTLEAVVAAVVVMVSLLFALQVAGVTSLSASTASGHLVDQQESVAAGVLDTAAADGSIEPTLLFWDDGEGTFYRSEITEPFYAAGPPTAFGAHLNETLTDRHVAYNVNLYGTDRNGTVVRRALVRNGRPSDDAVAATRTVTLYDDDRLLAANGTATGPTLANASFYVPDADPDGPLYNVVRVEVVAWPV
jgi:hypothetical protein